MRLFLVIGLTALLASASSASGPDFLTKSLNGCIAAESWSSCLKQQVLGYLDDKLGTSTEARSLDTVDEALVARTIKYLKSFDYGVNLPFVDASLKYRPSRSLADLDVEFKDNEVATSQARGLLKKKLLLPFLGLSIFVTLIALSRHIVKGREDNNQRDFFRLSGFEDHQTVDEVDSRSADYFECLNECRSG